MYIYLQTFSTPNYPVYKYEIQFSKHRGKYTFLFNVLLEFPFHSVFSVNKLLGIRGFHNKTSANFAALKCHFTTVKAN